LPRTRNFDQGCSLAERAGVSLPSPLQISENLAAVLARRKSIRRYTGAFPTAQQVGTILWHGEEPVDESTSVTPALLEVTLLALRVRDILPGIYDYRRQAHSLYAVGPLPERSEMLGLTLQEEFADAAFQIWITMSFERRREAAMPQSSAYRDALVRAGATADRFAVAATALGVGGCIIAGVVPAKAREFIGLDGYSKRVLVMFAGE
jgi:nitroreductase